MKEKRFVWAFCLLIAAAVSVEIGHPQVAVVCAVIMFFVMALTHEKS